MKKFLFKSLFAATAFLFAPEAQAQGLYVKLGAAYNLGLGGDIHYNSTTTVKALPSGTIPMPIEKSTEYERVDVNYGKGTTVGGTLGYMFTRFIGAEMGANYLIGRQNNLTEAFILSTTGRASSPFHFYDSYSRMLLLQPALVMTLGKERWNPYTRVGLTAAKGTVHHSLLYYNQDGAVQQELKYNGGLGFGMHGGVGLDFISLNKHLLLFAEVTFSELHYSPDKRTITKYHVAGQDRLKDLPLIETETTYADSFTANAAVPEPETSPAKGFRTNLPFSAAGFSGGLKFNF